VLSKLNNIKKIITETRTVEDNKSDIKDLNSYLKERDGLSK
jgi:hypothetical protein